MRYIIFNKNVTKVQYGCLPRISQLHRKQYTEDKPTDPGDAIVRQIQIADVCASVQSVDHRETIV